MNDRRARLEFMRKMTKAEWRALCRFAGCMQPLMRVMNTLRVMAEVERQKGKKR
jgi:hypothetical protein